MAFVAHGSIKVGYPDKLKEGQFSWVPRSCYSDVLDMCICLVAYSWRPVAMCEQDSLIEGGMDSLQLSFYDEDACF